MKIPLLTQPSPLEKVIPEEYPNNFEIKLPLIFVLDVSTSMQGEGIRQLNQGLKAFEFFFMEDPVALARLEIGILTFGTDIQIAKNFSALGQPAFPELKAGGRTLMKEGLENAFKLLESRKSWYKNFGLQYYRPYIIMITDGSPWPNKDLGHLPEFINQQMEERRFVFQAFGAGKANMRILTNLSHPEFPPLKISGYDFENFFRWLIPSISIIVSNSIAGNEFTTPKENVFQITL